MNKNSNIRSIIYKKDTQLIKDVSELPHYISYAKYLELRECIKNYYNKHLTRHRRFTIDRDLLLIDYLWETGLRISDCLSIKYENFNQSNRILKVYIKKRRKYLDIPIDSKSDLIENTLIYMQKYNIKQDQLLFNMTQQHAARNIKKYGRLINIDNLHPHMFRHGLALYLLSQGVPIEVISARLGHSNTSITRDIYLKVTPEIQAKIIGSKNIVFREELKK